MKIYLLYQLVLACLLLVYQSYSFNIMVSRSMENTNIMNSLDDINTMYSTDSTSTMDSTDDDNTMDSTDDDNIMDSTDDDNTMDSTDDDNTMNSTDDDNSMVSTDDTDSMDSTILSTELDSQSEIQKSQLSSEKFDKNVRRSKIDFSLYRFIAHLHQYPYHVAIATRADELILCQGALITPNWILTSGSCFEKYTPFLDVMQVVAGVVNTKDPKAIIRTISHAVYYPGFEPSASINDLALVKLNDDIEDKNGRTKTIALSTYKYPMNIHCNYSSFYEHRLYGWDLKLLDLSTCDSILKEPTQVLKYHCASVGALQFLTNIDLKSKLTHIGTPLVCGNQLYGIKTNDGFFTATNEIQSWVDSVIKI